METAGKSPRSNPAPLLSHFARYSIHHGVDRVRTSTRRLRYRQVASRDTPARAPPRKRRDPHTTGTHATVRSRPHDSSGREMAYSGRIAWVLQSMRVTVVILGA